MFKIEMGKNSYFQDLLDEGVVITALGGVFDGVELFEKKVKSLD